MRALTLRQPWASAAPAPRSTSADALAGFRDSGELGVARDYVRAIIAQWNTLHVRRLRRAQGWSLADTDPFPTAKEAATIVSRLTKWGRGTCRKRVCEVTVHAGKRPCAVTGHRVAMRRVR